MTLALDTNAYTAFCRGDDTVRRLIQHAESIVCPFVVIAELRAGFRAGVRGAENARVLTTFLKSPRVQVVYPDEQTTHHYAQLFYQLRQQGTPIPTNDLWIAALTLQHQWELLTFDHHFRHLPQLPLVLPLPH